MRETGTLAIQIEPATTASPTRVRIVATGRPLDDLGAMRLSADCLTLDELEAQINALQDELDALHAEARRAFSQSAGHA